MGLAQPLESSKCPRNAFYRHHYLRSDENSWHHQKQNGPCLPSSGKRKSRRGGSGGHGEEGKALQPRVEHPAPCVWTQAGREAPPCSPTDRWRGHSESGSSKAKNIGNVLMGREKQDSHWEIAFWLPGRLSVLGVAGCQPTGGSPLLLA